MTDLLIPNLDETVLSKLRARAQSNGRTVEDEARLRLAKSVGFDLDAYIADLREFRESSGPSKGPPAEELIREMREERTQYLDERSRNKE